MKKSLVSVILVASMMLSIGGCGLKKKNDSKILEGNWKADLECEKIVTDELSKDEDTKSNNMAMIDAIKKYADFNELEAIVTFKFNQDGTYSIEPDLEQWNVSSEKAFIHPKNFSCIVQQRIWNFKLIQKFFLGPCTYCVAKLIISFASRGLVL